MIVTETEPPPFIVGKESGAKRLSEIQEEIMDLKREKNAVLLAHNYQINEIQEVADYLGDSLGLAYKAAEADADQIVFCGVHFMAETAKIVNPGRKVILPDLEAGCSLSDSCPPEKLAAFKEENPDVYVVAYINCSAGVKALCDVICTSGNAAKIVSQVPEDREILFVPDQNLGQWVSQQTGRQMRLWPGSCYVHVLFTVQSIQRVKDQFPGAPVVAHPECTDAIRSFADHVCSTEGMIQYAREHSSEDIIVATESSMLYRLRKDVPEKTFIAAPAQQVACGDYRTGTSDRGACNYCRYMKMNTIEGVRDALKYGTPEITMDEETRRKAYVPLKRMLDWSR
ncbi:MAG: quinolinate synthase NadA [Verrucomicrobiota bacterium]